MLECEFDEGDISLAGSTESLGRSTYLRILSNLAAVSNNLESLDR